MFIFVKQNIDINEGMLFYKQQRFILYTSSFIKYNFKDME